MDVTWDPEQHKGMHKTAAHIVTEGISLWVVCSTPHALSPDALSPRALYPNGLRNTWKNEAFPFFPGNLSKAIILRSYIKETGLSS